MKSKSSKITLFALLVTCSPWVVSGCSDDSTDPPPGNGGESSGGKTSSGGAAGGAASAGKGGKNATGSAGSKAYAGSPANGGEGGDATDPTDGGSSSGGAGGTGGIGGIGGKGGAGGMGGKGGAGGTSGAGGTAGMGGSAGTGGTAGMGGAAGMSGTAGTGGSAGSGGSNPGPTCGNGVVDAGETCDPPTGKYTVDNCGSIWGAVSADPNGSANDCQVITPAACSSCEAASECAELMGTASLAGKKAEEGPAKDVLRSVLYNETLDCVRDTQCAATGLVIDCYCGNVSGSQCDAGNGNGKCRSVIERGLETTNPTDISARLTNLTLGGGLALALASCDQNNCLEPCSSGSPP